GLGLIEEGQDLIPRCYLVDCSGRLIDRERDLALVGAEFGEEPAQLHLDLGKHRPVSKRAAHLTRPGDADATVEEALVIEASTLVTSHQRQRLEDVRLPAA